MSFQDALYSILGERIKSYRNKMKINQEDLSGLVKISRSTVSNIEAGKHTVSVHILYNLAEKLNVPFHILLPIESEIIEKMTDSDQSSEAIKQMEKKNIPQDDIEKIKSLL